MSANNPKTISGAALDRAVWALRVRGYRVSEIARELNKNYNTVYASFRRGLERAKREAGDDAEEYRQRELQLIDDAMKKAMKLVDSGNLGAIDRMLALQARRARYISGLEVPRVDKHEIETSTVDVRVTRPERRRDD